MAAGRGRRHLRAMRSHFLLLPVVLAAAGLPAGCGGDVAPSQAMYCYKTLANVDCYNEPVPQDARRLVGFTGPPPPAPVPPRAPAVVPAPRLREVGEIWDGDQLSR